MVVSTTAGSPRADLAGKQLLFAVARPHRGGRLPRRRLPDPPAVLARALRPHAPRPPVSARSSASGSRARSRGSSSAADSRSSRPSSRGSRSRSSSRGSSRTTTAPILKTRTIVAVVAAVAVPVLLVLAQPDLGVALTYMPFARRGALLRGPQGPLVGDPPPRGHARDRRLVVLPEGLPEGPDPDVPRPEPRGARRRLPGAPGAHRDRLGRDPREGLEAGHAEPARVPARAAHGLHLRGARRGVGLRGRRGPPRGSTAS